MCGTEKAYVGAGSSPSASLLSCYAQVPSLCTCDEIRYENPLSRYKLDGARICLHLIVPMEGQVCGTELGYGQVLVLSRTKFRTRDSLRTLPRAVPPYPALVAA